MLIRNEDSRTKSRGEVDFELLLWPLSDPDNDPDDQSLLLTPTGAASGPFIIIPRALKRMMCGVLMRTSTHGEARQGTPAIAGHEVLVLDSCDILLSTNVQAIDFNLWYMPSLKFKQQC